MPSIVPDWLTMPDEDFHGGFRPTATPTPAYLHRALVRALGPAVVTVPTDDALKGKPLVLRLGLPLPPQLRFYVYQATQNAAERQTGTYKVQLTRGMTAAEIAGGSSIPSQAARRSARLYFDRSGGIRPILMGYHPDWRLFILWDADLHDLGDGFTYSTSVYAPPQTVIDALVHGLSRGSRSLKPRGTSETVIAVRPRQLVEALALRIRLSTEAMTHTDGLF